MPKTQKQRKRELDNWAKATGNTRRENTKRGITDPGSLLRSIGRATGKTIVDPNGQPLNPNKNRRKR